MSIELGHIAAEVPPDAAPADQASCGPANALDLTKIFDRVIVINLARRADRLARFQGLIQGNWPFAQPERFEAIDGKTVPMMPSWKKGVGAWGCLHSHRAVLGSAIADKVSSLLVLEDDAYPVPDLAAKAHAFFSSVPDDWHGLMLGAEHMRPPIPVSPGVVACTAAIRCHAYAVRGPLMSMLLSFWKSETNEHCDVVMSSLMRHFNFYAPDPLLIGQDAGQSDITPRLEPLRFLSPGQFVRSQ